MRASRGFSLPEVFLTWIGVGLVALLLSLIAAAIVICVMLLLGAELAEAA